jgi:hypothetical protein
LTAPTVIVLVTVALPPALVVVNLALIDPALVNLCVTVLPVADPPSPNNQADVVGLLVLVSVNDTVVDVVIPDVGV